MRIVSLIPEATEILEAIGVGDEVVAVPLDEARDDGRLAGILRTASPRLVFTSETSAGGGVPRSTVRRVVSGLRPRLDPRPAVFALEPRSLGEILSDVKTIGDAVGHQTTARTLIEALRARIDAVSLRSARAIADGISRRVVCLHDVDPPMAVGWWLAELVGLAGGLDALDGIGRPPRVVTWDEIQAARPDLVVRVGSGRAVLGAMNRARLLIPARLPASARPAPSLRADAGIPRSG
jgi:iron complex transport system substrate-binding protein